MSKRGSRSGALTFLLLSGLLGCGSQIEPKPPQPASTLLPGARSAVDQQSEEALRTVYDRLLAEPAVNDTDDYIDACILIASASIPMHIGDPYPLLTRAEGALRSSKRAAPTTERVFALASELVRINLHRSAYNLLRDFDSPNDHPATQLRNQLSALLTAWRGADVEGDHQARLKGAAEREWFLDLIDVNPQVIEYQALPQSPRPVPGITPLLVQTEAAPSRMVERARNYSLRTVRVDPKLSAEICRQLEDGDLDSARIEQQVARYNKQAIPSIAMVTEGSQASISWQDLAGEFRFLGFDCQGDRDVATSVAGSLFQSVRFVRPTAEGPPIVAIEGVQGSGRYLDVLIVDLARHALLWSAGEVPRGRVVITNLDTDAQPELLLTMEGAAVAHCGTCPSKRDILIADGQPDGSFVVTGHRSSRSDVASELDALTNPIAVSDQMFFSAAVDYGDLGTIFRRARAYRANGAHAANADFLGEALDRLWLDSPAAPDHRILAPLTLQRLEALVLSEQFEEVRKSLEDPRNQKSFEDESEWAAIKALYQGVSLLLEGDLAQGQRLLESAGAARAHFSIPALGNLAWYYNHVGDPSRARQSALGSINGAIRLGGAPSPINLLHMANAAGSARLPEKINWLMRFVYEGRRTGDIGQVAIAMSIAARWAMERGDFDGALELLDEGLISADSEIWSTEGADILSVYAEALARFGRVREAQKLFGAVLLNTRIASRPYAHARHQLARFAESNGDLHAALEQSKLAFESIVGISSSLGPERDKFSLLTSFESIADLYLRSAAASTPRELLTASSQWKLIVFADQRSKRLREVVGTWEALPEELAATLSVGDVAVDFVSTHQGLVANVVSRGAGPRRVVLGARIQSLRDWIDLTRRSNDIRQSESLRYIRRDQVPQPVLDAYQNLYRALIAPLALDASTRRLIVSPSSELNGLSWSALRDDAGDWLATKMEIVETPSMSLGLYRHKVLVERRDERNAVAAVSLRPVSAEMVDRALGSPSALADLPALRGAVADARAMSQTLRGYTVKVLVDSLSEDVPKGWTASESRAIEQLRSVSEAAAIIHIAAHGIYSERDPLDSAIFFGGNSGQHFLRARDLASWQLAKSQLVVLGACQSGRTEVRLAGEPIGFLRALMFADAPEVVVTLWEVDDAAAKLFFETFYPLRAGSLPSSHAFRSATLKLMKSHRHPYYWAGFSLNGTW